MSQQRRRSREARAAAVAARREQQQRRQARRLRVARVRDTAGRVVTGPGRALARTGRRRRYGSMPVQTRLLLACGWVGVQLVAWQLVSDVNTRVGVAIVSLLALPVVVVLFQPQQRRPR